MRVISEKDMALFFFNNLFLLNVAFYCSSEFDKINDGINTKERADKKTNRYNIIRTKETEIVCMQTEQATLPEGGR